jgi:hypothetical protein
MEIAGDPISSAELPHNFVNPNGDPIGPAEYFLNYSGLKGANLKAALASCGLEPITDDQGYVIGAHSKPMPKPTKLVKGSMGVTYTHAVMPMTVTSSDIAWPSYGQTVWGNPVASEPKTIELAPLDFDLKRRIELEGK